MVWDLGNFGLLMWLGRQKRIRLREGDLFWIYMVVYSIGRFAIESIRVDSARVQGFAVPQIIAILSIVLGWGLFMYNHRPGSTVPLSEANLPEGEVPVPQYAEGATGMKTRPSSRVRKVSASALNEPETADEV